MGRLVAFFLTGPFAPARLQLLLLAAGAVALGGLSLLVWGLYWRGEYRELKAAVVVYADQIKVSSDALERCNVGADEVRRVGDAAIAAMGPLVDAAREANKDRTRFVDSLDELARLKRKAGEGCDWAWERIEEQARKAGAAR